MSYTGDVHNLGLCIWLQLVNYFFTFQPLNGKIKLKINCAIKQSLTFIPSLPQNLAVENTQFIDSILRVETVENSMVSYKRSIIDLLDFCRTTWPDKIL